MKRSDLVESSGSSKNIWKGLNTEQKISLSVMLFLLFSLPLALFLSLSPIKLFLRAFLPSTPPVTSPATQTPTPRLTTIVINDSFDGNGAINPAKWGLSGSVGSDVSLAFDKLKVSVAAGQDNVGGNDAVAFPYVNYQIVYVPGDFEAEVDLLDVISSTGQSGSQEMKYGSSTLSLRRTQKGTLETIEALTGRVVPDTVLASVNLPPDTGSVRVRMMRIGSTVKGYYNLGNGFITLASVSADPYQSYQFPSLVVSNYSPDFPSTYAYFDNYYARGGVAGITPTPAASVTPYPTLRTYKLILNSASGKSCSYLCSQSGSSCLSVGTDYNGTNGLSWQSYRNSCEQIVTACDGNMKKSAKKACSGNQQPWTICRCN